MRFSCPLLVFIASLLLGTALPGLAQSPCTDTVTVQYYPSPLLSGDYTWREYSYTPSYCTTVIYNTTPHELKVTTSNLLGHCNCAIPCGEIKHRAVVNFANALPAGAEVLDAQFRLTQLYLDYPTGTGDIILSGDTFATSGVQIPLALGTDTIDVTSIVSSYVQNTAPNLRLFMRMPFEYVGGLGATLAGTEEADSTQWPLLTVTYVKNTQALVSKTGVGCGSTNDGTATATAAFGTAPYTWSWGGVAAGTSGNMATNLPLGAFSVMLTDSNGCTHTFTDSIVQATSPSLSISGVNASCAGAGGSASVVASAGQSPYSYAWSNGGSSSTISGISSGTYSVTVTDGANCTASATVSVGSDPGPSATAYMNTPYSCPYGGSAVVGGSGGVSPYTYVFGNVSPQTVDNKVGTHTFYNLSAGTYNAYVYDAQGCVDSSSVTITDQSSMALTVDSVAAPVSCDSTNGYLRTTVSGGTPFSNGGDDYYQHWYYDSNNSLVGLHDADTLALGLVPGTYFLLVYDSDYCQARDTVTVPECATCDSVANLRELNVQDTSVYLGWDTVAGATIYKIRWKQAGSGPWNVAIKNGNTGIYQLNGLAPSTTYWWVARAKCGATGWGAASASQSFTTLAQPCWVPDGLTTSPVHPSQARINWNQQPGAVKYRIRFRQQGATSWQVVVKTAAWDKHWFTGLTGGATYEWQIKTVCQQGVATGTQWSPLQTFSVPIPKAFSVHPASETAPLPLDARVFPNPGNGLFNVAIEGGTGQQVQCIVTDMPGKVIYQQVGSDLTTLQLDLHSAGSGIYLLTVLRGTQRKVLRLAVE